MPTLLPTEVHVVPLYWSVNRERTSQSRTSVGRPPDVAVEAVETNRSTLPLDLAPPVPHVGGESDTDNARPSLDEENGRTGRVLSSSLTPCFRHTEVETSTRGRDDHKTSRDPRTRPAPPPDRRPSPVLSPCRRRLTGASTKRHPGPSRCTSRTQHSDSLVGQYGNGRVDMETGDPPPVELPLPGRQRSRHRDRGSYSEPCIMYPSFLKISLLPFSVQTTN